MVATLRLFSSETPAPSLASHASPSHAVVTGAGSPYVHALSRSAAARSSALVIASQRIATRSWAAVVTAPRRSRSSNEPRASRLWLRGAAREKNHSAKSASHTSSGTLAPVAACARRAYTRAQQGRSRARAIARSAAAAVGGATSAQRSSAVVERSGPSSMAERSAEATSSREVQTRRSGSNTKGESLVGPPRRERQGDLCAGLTGSDITLRTSPSTRAPRARVHRPARRSPRARGAPRG